MARTPPHRHGFLLGVELPTGPAARPQAGRPTFSQALRRRPHPGRS